MNAKLLLASIATTAFLTACGGDHEHVKAVDKVAEMEVAAKEKAPKAEAVTFDDEGKPTIGGAGGVAGASTKTEAKAESESATTTEEKLAEQADTATAEATAEASAETTAEATTDSTSEEKSAEADASK